MRETQVFECAWGARDSWLSSDTEKSLKRLVQPHDQNAHARHADARIAGIGPSLHNAGEKRPGIVLSLGGGWRTDW